MPKPGHVVLLTTAASPQFSRPYTFRVIRPQPWPTYDGWVWLHGYELDGHGQAVGHKPRDLFVQINGLRRVPDPVDTYRNRRPTDGRTSTNARNGGPR